MNNNTFINYGVSFNRCNRTYMEDYNKIFISENLKYFSICDGHGGDLVSKYINDNFLSAVQEHCYHLTKYNYKLFFTETAIALDNELKAIHYNICKKSGSTYIGVIIYDNYLYIINIGDSIINLNVNNNVVFKNLRHTPKAYIEEKRILKHCQIFNNRINGILNVSRGFGDFYFKPNKNNVDNPIICLPDIKKYDLLYFSDKKSFIILASDGILLHLSLEKINKYVYDMLSSGHDPQYIADILVNFYKQKNNNDNITLIIITLNNLFSNN